VNAAARGPERLRRVGGVILSTGGAQPARDRASHRLRGVETISTRTARIELVDERIVVARINGDHVQSLDDARANLEACVRLAAPGRKPLLVDIRAARPLLPEVRLQYAGEQFNPFFAAMGLLVRNNPLGITMGNIYFKIARPGIPTRIFSDEPKALAWLHEIK
jgi:hypothetical protein